VGVSLKLDWVGSTDCGMVLAPSGSDISPESLADIESGDPPGW
jgi:hypothetical protein